LATLTAPVAWNDKSGYTDIVGATFQSKFAAVYTARQALLNAIYAAAKKSIDTNAANTPLVINPYFTTGDLTGWTSDHGTVAFQSGSNGPASGSTTYAIRTGSSGTPNEALRNTAKIPVYAGAVVKAQCAIRGIGTPNGTAGVRISWRDSTDTELSSTQGNTTTGNATNGTYVTGTAPAGAMFAHVECGFYNHTVGQYTIDNFAASSLADSMDQVPDGTSRFGAIEAGADKTSGKPLSSLSGRTMDFIGDSATRFAAAESGADKTAGKSLTVLTDRILDNVADSATYLRTIQQSTSESVDNASFDLASDPQGDIPGWFSLHAAVLSLSTTQHYVGGQALVVTASAANGQAATTRAYSCRPGDVYLVSGAVLSTGVSASGIFIGFFDAAGNYLGNGDSQQLSDVNNWVVLNGIGTAPANAISFRIVCIVGAAGDAGFFDAIKLSRVRSLDAEIADGTTYGRVGNADLYNSGGVNRVGLRIPGSGHTLGDQRNLLLQTWGGMRSVLSTSPISFSISGTTVNFSVAAVTLQGAGTNLNYAASSGSVTQTAGTTTTYFLYYIDNAQAGGSLPLNITTNPGGPASWPNGMLLGTATVTVASGGGGSGGTGGGGGGYCVADDMFIAPGRLAGDAEIGDPFDCIDLPTAAGKHVRALQGVSRGVEECVRMITNDGCALVCSVSTPFDLPNGRSTTAPHMLGEQVITDLGIATVTSLALVGPQPVTRAHLGGVSYAAGADPHRRIYSHNIGGTSKP